MQLLKLVHKAQVTFTEIHKHDTTSGLLKHFNTTEDDWTFYI